MPPSSVRHERTDDLPLRASARLSGGDRGGDSWHGEGRPDPGERGERARYGRRVRRVRRRLAATRPVRTGHRGPTARQVGMVSGGRSWILVFRRSDDRHVDRAAITRFSPIQPEAKAVGALPKRLSHGRRAVPRRRRPGRRGAGAAEHVRCRSRPWSTAPPPSLTDPTAPPHGFHLLPVPDHPHREAPRSPAG